MTDNKEMFDINRFFTRDNSEKGVPFEPVVDGEKVGISFNVISYSSIKAARAVEKFNKEIEELKKEEDAEVQRRRTLELNAELATALVVGFSDGSRGEVVMDGEPLKYSESVCYAIMLNSLPIANAIIEHSLKVKNFMGRSA